MSLVRALSVLVVKQVLTDRAESLFGFLGDRFSDNARRLEKALHNSSARAWQALELALAGSSWWQAVTSTFTSHEEQGLVQHIRAYLTSLPPDVLPAREEAFRNRCLNDLRSARRVGLVPGTSFSVHAAAGDAQAFARYAG